MRQVRGETIGVGDAFGGGPYFVQMLIANFLLGVMYFAGLLACCIGIIAVSGLMLPAQAMVADGVPAMDAITRSYNAMKADWGSAAMFSFVMGLVVLAGIIPCGLGLFATVPMLYLDGRACVSRYGGMTGNTPFTPDYGAPQPGAWPPPPNTGASASFGQPGGAPQPGAWPSQPTPQPGAWPPQSPPPPSAPSTDWPTQSAPPPFGQPAPRDTPDDPNRPLG